MNQAVVTLLLGFALGIKHAFEADHMIAVSTVVTEQKNPLRAALVGTFWGIGHTTTLFVVGIIVLLFNLRVPERVSTNLELLVAVMLIFLGIRAIYTSRTFLHSHPHAHGRSKHSHPHPQGKGGHFHRHKRSFLIGTVHGLAGSGALMLLVLATIHSLIQGLYYILIFGVGSITGMTVISFFIGTPFIYSANKFPQIEKYLKVTAGLASVLFGFFLIYKILKYMI